MNIGDVVMRDSDTLLIVRELTFKEYCDKHDDLELEYDIDDAWEAWQTAGPCFLGLHPEGKLVVLWPE
tara:strand:- start:533 stop:736 length:204 start_codon:yes stop_codon:yes gene_type:complete